MTEGNPTNMSADARLSKLEAMVGSIASSVREMGELHRSEVRAITTKLDAIGKPNYQGLGVLISAIVAIGSMGAFAVMGPITNNRTTIAANKEELSGRLDRMYDQLQRSIEGEQVRNNRIEREIGALMETNSLFKAGLLQLGNKGGG